MVAERRVPGQSALVVDMVELWDSRLRLLHLLHHDSDPQLAESVKNVVKLEAVMLDEKQNRRMLVAPPLMIGLLTGQYAWVMLKE